ncbi:MAG TPA: phenylalanine--tRNA ligase subunit beta [Terriglobia bacterium]|nr:phenylalanine--tRNA ligase subunit beta [Terriglobia bacterium]
MKISLNWLNEFVDLPADRRALEARLPMLGLGVASSLAVGADHVLDLEVTTNRPDCLGHLGVAREVAAAFGEGLNCPSHPVPEVPKPVRDAVAIEISDLDGCARYCGRVIENVIVRPSPEWLARRLEAVGVRPVNNVADATNYALMELGHPLHAFDLARLRGARIEVRRARAGERLQTLDGVERELAKADLVIADAERAVALAGVMGGADTEITSATRQVMLESAWFEPVGVRRTAKRHGLHTEASHRFERGMDIEMARQAVDRTAALVAELAGGQILEGVIDIYPQRRVRPTIVLRSSEIRRILGAEIETRAVARYLSALGFSVEPGPGASWRVIPPSFRLDVEREIDLVEEVARLEGYDTLPMRVRAAPPSPERDLRREKELAISSTLTALGYREIIVPSMVDPGENARFTVDEPVPLLNPLSQDASALRSTAVPGMLRALRWNLDRGQTDLRFFEMGKIYTTSERSSEGLPAEHRLLTLGATGSRRSPGVHDAPRALDFFDLKGDLETLLATFDAGTPALTPGDMSYHEPGLGASFAGREGVLARFGQLHHEVAREYKVRQPVYLAEVNLDRLLSLDLRLRGFRPIPRFPAVERDLSLLVPATVSYRQVEDAVGAVGLTDLQGFRAVDRFEGGALPPDHYSLLLRIVLQSPERTLIGEEAEASSRMIVSALAPLGIRLRSA